MAASKKSIDNSQDVFSVHRQVGDSGGSGFTLNLLFMHYVTANPYIGASVLLSITILFLAVLTVFLVVVTGSMEKLDVSIIFSFIKSAFLLIAGIGLLRR